MPVNVSTTGSGEKDHWILFHINTMHDRLYVYDSMRNPEQYEPESKCVQRWWTCIEKDLQQLRVEFVKKTVKQTDTYNCGLLVCLQLRRLMLKRKRPIQVAEWNISPNWSQWRCQIITELAEDKIKPADDI